MTTQELAEITSGRLVGDPTVAINGINRIEHARSNEITFLSNEQYVKFLPLTKAGCVIISESLFASARISLRLSGAVCTLEVNGDWAIPRRGNSITTNIFRTTFINQD